MRSNLRAGIRFSPTFFSWLGITQYLSPVAVLGTLREVAGLAAPGSEIVFQYVVPASTLAGEERALAESLAGRAAEVGEPWLSFFEPEELDRDLKDMRFSEISHFGPQHATERYLVGRTDGLGLPAYFHMINAQVG